MRPIYRCRVCGTFTEEPTHCGKPAQLFMTGEQRERLSKLMSALLRHIPEQAGLKLDPEGFVNIDELVKGIRERWRNRDLYRWVTRDHIIAVAQLDPKGRFEICGDKIRARYGHSARLKVQIQYEEDREHRYLYHGTAEHLLSQILREGLKPMRRQWVHLTDRLEDAIEVGRRRGRPVILVIDTEILRKLGHRVFRAGKTVYVTDYVPPQAITKILKP